MKTKVVVGLSGGVDSSVTAYLLQKMGYEVIGVYMKLHDTLLGYHEQNIESIEQVTQYLRIPYYVFDVRKEFGRDVYDYFVQDYIKGSTPNPCVKCNRTIKFGALVSFAKALGADKLATGHYAKTDGEFIYEADDSHKDQSYFLAQVEPQVLPFVLFPMSSYQKQEIVQIAQEIPMLRRVAQKKESQEICFVETVYTDILKKHTNIDLPGKTLDEMGNEIGHHKGYMHYTIGKRKGFYVHGAHDPHFVKSLDPKNNTITVVKKPALAMQNVQLKDLNMFVADKEFQAQVKLRYRSQKVPCFVQIKSGSAVVYLQEPVLGIAKGQVAVFYDKSKVIGSGWITKAY